MENEFQLTPFHVLLMSQNIKYYVCKPDDGITLTYDTPRVTNTVHCLFVR